MPAARFEEPLGGTAWTNPYGVRVSTGSPVRRRLGIANDAREACDPAAVRFVGGTRRGGMSTGGPPAMTAPFLGIRYSCPSRTESFFR